MNLHNKTVIVTGASTGIGEQIALRLAKTQCRLALIARNAEKLQQVAETAKKLGAIDARYYACDICDTDKLTETVEKITNDFSTIDVLINNAGIWQKMGQVDELSADTIDNVIATNLSAVIHTTRLVLPKLRQSEQSAIINIVSKSGVLAQAGQAVYTASKYGVRGFTEVLKADLKGSTVKIAGIYQGGTNTEMFAKTGENIDTSHCTDPADLADVVAYLLQQPHKIWLHDVRIDR